MANCHSEFEAIDLKELPGVSGNVQRVFCRVELVLGLNPLNLAMSVQDNGRNMPARTGMPFHSEDGGNLVCSRPLCHGLERQLLLRRIKGRYFEVQSPETWKIGFREADELRALGRGFGEGLLDFVQALLNGGSDAR